MYCQVYSRLILLIFSISTYILNFYLYILASDFLIGHHVSCESANVSSVLGMAFIRSAINLVIILLYFLFYLFCHFFWLLLLNCCNFKLVVFQFISVYTITILQFLSQLLSGFQCLAFRRCEISIVKYVIHYLSLRGGNIPTLHLKTFNIFFSDPDFRKIYRRARAQGTKVARSQPPPQKKFISGNMFENIKFL